MRTLTLDLLGTLGSLSRRPICAVAQTKLLISLVQPLRVVIWHQQNYQDTRYQSFCAQVIVVLYPQREMQMITSQYVPGRCLGLEIYPRPPSDPGNQNAIHTVIIQFGY